VNTGKDGPGVSWFRVALFNLGFVAFFAATFGGLWLLYDRMAAALAFWRGLAGSSGAAPASLEAITMLPPQEWLWGLWGFNVMVLLLATVLLRQGGYGRK
jgi:hypothetical protein